MSDSQSDYLFVPLNPDELVDGIEKRYQASELLVRNKRYIDSVDAIRQKYGIHSQVISGDEPGAYDLELESSKDLELFNADVRLLAEKIQFPGDWFKAVKLHVLGLETSASLNPDTAKFIEAIRHSDYIELRVYGNPTQPELRSALKKITEFTGQGKPKTSNIKHKPRFEKNLIIYDLHKKGLSYNEIAQYCDDKKLHVNIGYENISKYIELAEQQIEKILA